MLLPFGSVCVRSGRSRLHDDNSRRVRPRNLATSSVEGWMKRNSDTASGCSVIAKDEELGFVAGLPLRTVPSCAYAQWGV